jgi:hypothetical protein
MPFIRYLGSILALASFSAIGSPMLEGQTKSLTTEYDDGDRISILCSNNSCGLNIRVDGKAFAYTQADFGNLHLTPRFAHMYAYPRTKPLYFVIEVSVWCPDADEMPQDADACTAGASVEEGKPLRLTLDHHP